MSKFVNPKTVTHGVVIDTKSYGFELFGLSGAFFEANNKDFQEYFNQENPHQKTDTAPDLQTREEVKYGLEDVSLKNLLMRDAIKRAGFFLHKYENTDDRYSKNRNAGNLISWDFTRVAEKISLESGLDYNPKWVSSLEAIADEQKLELVPNR